MNGYFVERNYKGEFPYTDLAVERRRADLDIPGIEYTKEYFSVGCWERLKISTKRGAEAIGRPIGIYDTLQCERIDLIDSDRLERAKEAVAGDLCDILDSSDIFPGRL